MTLDNAKVGSFIRIISIPDEVIRAQAIRLGVGEGSLVCCLEKLPSGPVIIKNGFQEIAVGRQLAKNITVKIS